MAKAPSTSAPTDFEWENHARWAVGPVGTRKQLWISKEAAAIHFERTGRYDTPATTDDYSEAALRVSTANS